jgi:polysaccharide biosynthesis protein PelA
MDVSRKRLASASIDVCVLSSQASAVVTLLALLGGLAGCAGPGRNQRPGRDLGGVKSWWIFIGHDAETHRIDWRRQSAAADLAVLADDPRIRLADLAPGTIRLGYLSVGEADMHRAYWPAVQHQPFLVETNPAWPDNVRVDVRDPRWQELLINQEAPRLLRLGFQGFMLDTLDTAPYLERKDPARFSGSREALRNLLERLRRAFPQAIIIANGTDSLVDAAPFVDGYVIEGAFATYDFGGWVYRATTEEEREWKLGQLARALEVVRRPVFSVEYAGPQDRDLATWASAEARSRGFRPYVTVKEINRAPLP